jgi:hypothetical protein
MNTPLADALIGKMVGSMISSTDAETVLSFRSEIAELETELATLKQVRDARLRVVDIVGKENANLRIALQKNETPQIECTYLQ